MVLFNDSFGQTEPKSPAPLFSSKPRFEYLGYILFADALAGVGNINDHLGLLLKSGAGDLGSVCPNASLNNTTRVNCL